MPEGAPPPEAPVRRSRRAAFLVPLSLYALSLALPARIDRPLESLGFGAMCLLAAVAPPFTIPWLANPLFVLSLVLLRRRRHRNAWRCAAAGLLLALTSPLFTMRIRGASWQIWEFPPFHLWVAALAVLLGFTLREGRLEARGAVSEARTGPGTPR
jgi:hypothetical protein